MPASSVLPTHEQGQNDGGDGVGDDEENPEENAVQRFADLMPRHFRRLDDGGRALHQSLALPG